MHTHDDNIPEDSITDVTEDFELKEGDVSVIVFKANEGLLFIKADQAFLNNMSVSKETPVDLCFPSPLEQNKHFCFHNVTAIKSILDYEN